MPSRLPAVSRSCGSPAECAYPRFQPMRYASTVMVSLAAGSTGGRERNGISRSAGIEAGECSQSPIFRETLNKNPGKVSKVSRFDGDYKHLLPLQQQASRSRKKGRSDAGVQRKFTVPGVKSAENAFPKAVFPGQAGPVGKWPGNPILRERLRCNLTLALTSRAGCS